MTLCAKCNKLLPTSAAACPYCGFDVAESKLREKKIYRFAGIGAAIGGITGLALSAVIQAHLPVGVLPGIGAGIGAGVGGGIGMRSLKPPK
jgi:ribosomal protein L40E